MSWRNPPLRDHGKKVVGGLCTYELLALPDWSPLPTISELIQRHRDAGRRPAGRLGYAGAGIALLGLLAHHWFVELVDQVGSATEALGEMMMEA